MVPINLPVGVGIAFGAASLISSFNPRDTAAVMLGDRIAGALSPDPVARRGDDYYDPTWTSSGAENYDKRGSGTVVPVALRRRPRGLPAPGPSDAYPVADRPT